MMEKHVDMEDLCSFVKYRVLLGSVVAFSHKDAPRSRPVPIMQTPEGIVTTRTSVIICALEYEAEPEKVAKALKDLALLVLVRQGMSERAVSAILGPPAGGA